MRIIFLIVMLSSLQASPLCRSLFNGKCYLCQHSVHMNDSCVPRINHASNCLEYDFPKSSIEENKQKKGEEEKGVCVRCAYGFRLDEQTKFCVRCSDPRCVRCEANGECSVCFDNKLPFEGRCSGSKLTGKDPKCLIVTQHGCALCKEDYAFTENGDYLPAPPLCQELSEDRTCATCLFGAYMDVNGNCKGTPHPLVFDVEDLKSRKDPSEDAIKEKESHLQEASEKSSHKPAEKVEKSSEKKIKHSESELGSSSGSSKKNPPYNSKEEVEKIESEEKNAKKKKSAKDMDDIKWKTVIAAIVCLIFYSICNYYFTRRQAQVKEKED